MGIAGRRITNKQYVDKRELLTLLASGETYTDVGEKLGLDGSRSTANNLIRRSMKELKISYMNGLLKPEDSRLYDLALKRIRDRVTRQDVKRSLGQLFRLKAEKALRTITTQKLKDSSAAQLATIAGIAVDKARLLADESTENIALKGDINLSKFSNKDLIKRLNEIREKNANTVQ